MMPEQIDLTPVRGCHILVAFSGGADSTALLTLLAENRERCRLRITAAHLNHMIRGEEADGDEAFCRRVCTQLGINLIRSRLDIPAIAKESGLGLETCAREERYRFLRAAKEKCGAELIALAHHADDQVETTLMHLFRGTGPEGICGMPVLGRELYRPLLHCSKHEITQWLISKGIEWREDSTNTVADTPRNALRLKILPQIEALYPGVKSAVSRFTRSAQIENSYLAGLTREHLSKAAEHYPCGVRLDTGIKCDEAILRRSVRALCEPDLNFDKLEEILLLTREESGRTDCTGNLSVERVRGALWFINTAYNAPEAVSIAENSITCLNGIAEIALTPGRYPIEPRNPMTECIDLSALGGAQLRTRRPGDRIHPLGSPGTRLLSDCMVDRKIERPLRDCLPLIAQGDRVLWCLGVGISEELKITDRTQTPGRLDIRLFHSEGNCDE